jgi:hypothetical protein
MHSLGLGSNMSSVAAKFPDFTSFAFLELGEKMSDVFYPKKIMFKHFDAKFTRIDEIVPNIT